MIVCRGGGLGNWLHFCIDTCQQLWCNQVLFTWKQKFPGCHPFVPPSHVAPPRFERTTCGSGGMVSCTLKNQHNSCDIWMGKWLAWRLMKYHWNICYPCTIQNGLKIHVILFQIVISIKLDGVWAKQEVNLVRFIYRRKYFVRVINFLHKFINILN